MCGCRSEESRVNEERCISYIRGGTGRTDAEELCWCRVIYTTDYQSAYQDADVIFIGVGTPEMPDGSANLKYIATVSRQIAESVKQDCLVVVKSTVPVGTNDKVEQFIKDFLVNDVKIEVASNPEFLAQGTAVHDTLHVPQDLS